MTKATLSLEILQTEAKIFAEKESKHEDTLLYGVSDGNIDDILAFFGDRMLPLDEIQAQALAEEVLNTPPQTGYLTISNALQWRLQYNRVIQKAGAVEGIKKVL